MRVRGEPDAAAHEGPVLRPPGSASNRNEPATGGRPDHVTGSTVPTDDTRTTVTSLKQQCRTLDHHLPRAVQATCRLCAVGQTGPDGHRRATAWIQPKDRGFGDWSADPTVSTDRRLARG